MISGKTTPRPMLQKIPYLQTQPICPRPMKSNRKYQKNTRKTTKFSPIFPSGSDGKKKKAQFWYYAPQRIQKKHQRSKRGPPHRNEKVTHDNRTMRNCVRSGTKLGRYAPGAGGGVGRSGTRWGEFDEFFPSVLHTRYEPSLWGLGSIYMCICI